MTLGIDLTGRVAIVTGAAGGIGEGIARRLAAAGAVLALVDRDEAGLARLGGLGLAVGVDLVDEDSVSEAVARIASELGGPHVLVNNAAVAATTLGMPFTRQSTADWERVMRVNCVGTFAMSKAVALRMLDQGGGVIVNIASVSGRTGMQTDPAYSASKAATINFTQVMAKDLAPMVRVNAIAPGMVLTPFYEAQHAAVAAHDERVAAMTPEQVSKFESVFRSAAKKSQIVICQS